MLYESVLLPITLLTMASLVHHIQSSLDISLRWAKSLRNYPVVYIHT